MGVSGEGGGGGELKTQGVCHKHPHSMSKAHPFTLQTSLSLAPSLSLTFKVIVW